MLLDSLRQLIQLTLVSDDPKIELFTLCSDFLNDLRVRLVSLSDLSASSVNQFHVGRAVSLQSVDHTVYVSDVVRNHYDDVVVLAEQGLVRLEFRCREPDGIDRSVIFVFTLSFDFLELRCEAFHICDFRELFDLLGVLLVIADEDLSHRNPLKQLDCLNIVNV